MPVRCGILSHVQSHNTKILVVDDEPAMREVLEMRLQEWGFSVRLAKDGVEAKELAESFDPDIVISDVVMPEISGIELLRSLKSGDAHRPVILVTAQGRMDMAVEAMKGGAMTCLDKDDHLFPNLKAELAKAEKEIERRREARKLVSQLERGTAGFGDFIGVSKPMREVYDLIRSIGATDASVIITGESGTGKELAAQTIHRLSARSSGPFIAINAAAIPENLMESEIFGHEKGSFTGAVGARAGCFEMSDRGTLFLDEISEMPLALQPKLLRVLEDRRVRRLGGSQEFSVDVRVLAATNREPRDAVENGRLREDLFYRLNVFTVSLSPLRERKSDIELLVHSFIREFNKKHNAHVESLRDEALEPLKAYSWPGNVRELRNVIERAVILAKGDWIEPSHLPAYILNARPESVAKIVLPPGVTAAEAERELILRTLKRTGNNKAEAARQLGLDVKTIRNKLKSYGIS